MSLPVKAGTPPLPLAPDDVCASCGIREFGHVGEVRHIVRRGGLTTVCGCMASHPDVWRGNRTKPRCASCVAKYRKDEQR